METMKISSQGHTEKRSHQLMNSWLSSCTGMSICQVRVCFIDCTNISQYLNYPLCCTKWDDSVSLFAVRFLNSLPLCDQVVWPLLFLSVENWGRLGLGWKSQKICCDGNAAFNSVLLHHLKIPQKCVGGVGGVGEKCGVNVDLNPVLIHHWNMPQKCVWGEGEHGWELGCLVCAWRLAPLGLVMLRKTRWFPNQHLPGV